MQSVSGGITVDELMEKLKTLPGDMEIFVGYEGIIRPGLSMDVFNDEVYGKVFVIDEYV